MNWTNIPQITEPVNEYGVRSILIGILEHTLVINVCVVGITPILTGWSWETNITFMVQELSATQCSVQCKH